MSDVGDVADIVAVAAQGPLKCDGVLSEPDWARAALVPALTRFLPGAGSADTEVEARILTDDRAVWVAFTVRTERTLNGPIVPRDDILFHDWVGVSFDTFRSEQRSFEFRVNGRGVQADGIFVEGEDWWDVDTSWDEVWDSAGRMTDDGYTVEIAIPFRSLRYPRGETQSWGIIVTHSIPTPFTINTWPALSRDQNSILGQAATVRLAAPPPRGVTVEVNPTVTGRYDFGGEQFAVDPGGAARVGLSSAVTLDLAINPDFSQIEADADQVTANVKYPLSYDEKRPFFLEGADVFASPLDVLYSRSVADPLAGVKVTGRAGPVALGALSAWDEAPGASTISVDYATLTARPGWNEEVVAGARALDSVARATWDFGEGVTVGGLYSNKELFGATDSVLANHVAGADARVPFAERYEVVAQALYSTTDLPDGTRLSGPAAALAVERSGDQFQAGVEGNWISSDFRAENGFLTEVGRGYVAGGVGWRVRDWAVFRTLDPGIEVEASFDPAGVPVWAAGGGLIESLFGTNGFAEQGFFFIRERFWGVEFNRWSYNGFVTIDPTPHSNVWFGYDVGPDPHYDAETEEDLYLGFSSSAEVGATAALAARLQLDASVLAEQFRNPAKGEVVYSTLINRFRANLNVTRPFSLRLIEEWNTFDGTLDSSLLVAYEHNYGTAAYVGYSEQYDLGSGEWTARNVFAKVGYLWRP